VAILVALADGTGALLNPMFLFSSMYLVRRKLIANTPHPVNSIESTPASLISKELQKRIAERGLLLVSVQFLTYSCTATKVFYEMIMGVRTPFELDMMAYIMHISSLCVNPICFYILDGHATNNPIKRFFMKKPVESKKTLAVSQYQVASTILMK
jgi:hypothetical protein